MSVFIRGEGVTVPKEGGLIIVESWWWGGGDVGNGTIEDHGNEADIDELVVFCEDRKIARDVIVGSELWMVKL